MTIDGEQLDMHEFNGVVQRKIIIHPPAKKSEADGFDLRIEKLNVLKIIQKGHNPLDTDNLIKDTLWNEQIKYSEQS